MTRSKDIKNVDHLIESLGKPKFQVLTFLFLCGNYAIIFCNHIAMVFYAAKTKHHCKVDNIELVPIVTKNNEQQWDSCHVYTGYNTTEIMSCTDGWTYYFDDGESNIISEFDLVCDNAYKSDLAITMYFCGVMISGIFFGFLADKYGRKPVISFTLFTSGLVGVGIFMFRNYVTFVILRFILGFLIQGLQNSTFVLAMEQFLPKYRAPAGFVMGIAMGVGALVFDLTTYLIRDWKYVQLFIALVLFLQIFTLYFIPESLRWHMVYQNFNKAEKIVKRTVSFNKSLFPRQLFNEVKRASIKESSSPTFKQNANILDIFKSRKLRWISLILSVIWFTISATFYGLTFNISSLFGDIYLNFAISTVLDMVSNSAMIWVVPRYGFRKPLSLCLFSAAVANCVCILASLTTTASKSANILVTTMAIIGKSFIAATLNLMFIFTTELYPTVVRNISLGMNTLWMRIGGMAAPQIFFLGLYTPAYVPYTILATLTMLSGFLTLLLPETSKLSLSDRLQRGRAITVPQDSESFQENVHFTVNEKILYVTSL